VLAPQGVCVSHHNTYRPFSTASADRERSSPTCSWAQDWRTRLPGSFMKCVDPLEGLRGVKGEGKGRNGLVSTVVASTLPFSPAAVAVVGNRLILSSYGRNLDAVDSHRRLNFLFDSPSRLCVLGVRLLYSCYRLSGYVCDFCRNAANVGKLCFTLTH
jgi:hypothetical protein